MSSLSFVGDVSGPDTKRMAATAFWLFSCYNLCGMEGIENDGDLQKARQLAFEDAAGLLKATIDSQLPTLMAAFDEALAVMRSKTPDTEYAFLTALNLAHDVSNAPTKFSYV